jgi:hypothetical protein
MPNLEPRTKTTYPKQASSIHLPLTHTKKLKIKKKSIQHTNSASLKQKKKTQTHPLQIRKLGLQKMVKNFTLSQQFMYPPLLFIPHEFQQRIIRLFREFLRFKEMREPESLGFTR